MRQQPFDQKYRQTGRKLRLSLCSSKQTEKRSVTFNQFAKQNTHQIKSNSLDNNIRQTAVSKVGEGSPKIARRKTARHDSSLHQMKELIRCVSKDTTLTVVRMNIDPRSKLRTGEVVTPPLKIERISIDRERKLNFSLFRYRGRPT